MNLISRHQSLVSSSSRLGSVIVHIDGNGHSSIENRESTERVRTFLRTKLRSPCYKYKGSIGKRQPNSCNVFKYPNDVLVDEKRSMIFVSDCGELNIQVFDLHQKEFLFNISSPDRPRFMCLYYNSLIFSCENNLVYRYDLETRQEVWTSKKANAYSDIQTMNNPCGVVSDEMDEKIYVCDCNQGRIVVLNGDNGMFYRSIDLSTRSKNQYDVRPYGIDINVDYNLVFSNIVNAKIHIVTKTGVPIAIIGSPGSSIGLDFNFPSGVLVNSKNGNILVCDRNNHRVQVLSSKGQYIKCFGSCGYDVGQFYEPRGLCIDHSSGDLYIVDYGNDRIQIFEQFT
ncbi:hypothetical protein C9374_000519 [Naegleria lovaniensis]|uniref:NHL repeat domain-containing protein n=1 Tax=Naegleria lovaniensis TaxID=51637 RepID=A0AA88GT22_NAELO|nr:uncharacterized protein C9374_000519 [Naegleria lovaniensis]KAG2388355.1 hypothetical protein C9374_000519 [Naegleria lovaniensis]